MEIFELIHTYLGIKKKKGLNFKMPYEHGRLLRTQKTYKIDGGREVKMISVFWLSQGKIEVKSLSVENKQLEFNS